MKVSFELNTISSLNLLKLIQEENLYLGTLEINLRFLESDMIFKYHMTSCRIDKMEFFTISCVGSISCCSITHLICIKAHMLIMVTDQRKAWDFNAQSSFNVS